MPTTMLTTHLIIALFLITFTLPHRVDCGQSGCTVRVDVALSRSKFGVAHYLLDHAWGYVAQGEGGSRCMPA